MNMTRTSSAAWLAFLFSCSGLSAHAATLPSLCFTAENYKLYLQALKDHEAQRSRDSYEAVGLAAKQKIPVSIVIKQSQPSSGAPVTLDASESKVPSGQALFYWGNAANIKAESPIKNIPGGTSGGYFNTTLTVTDDVCDHSATSRISVTYK